jgi:cysteine-rich repeat protein
VTQTGCAALLDKIVVAPIAITEGSVPVSVEVFPRPGKENATLRVTAAAGTISKVNNTTWTFLCGSASGNVNLTATATLEQCTESASVGFACPGGSAGGCGNGQIDAGEACDGSALPPGTPSGSTCASNCLSILPPPAACGDGIINGSEACDTNGANPDVLPPGTPAGSSCAANCLSIVGPAATCPNGTLNPGEQCDDGNNINDDRCSNTCVFTANSECGACTRDNCAAERADVDANLSNTTPMLECVLGPDWEAVERASPTSCANQDLFSCYCGPIPGPTCVNTTPAALVTAGAPCVAPVLAGTNCTTSVCVGPIYNNPANANGKVIQYLTCQQNFCFEQCFNF